MPPAKEGIAEAFKEFCDEAQAEILEAYSPLKESLLKDQSSVNGFRKQLAEIVRRLTDKTPEEEDIPGAVILKIGFFKEEEKVLDVCAVLPCFEGNVMGTRGELYETSGHQIKAVSYTLIGEHLIAPELGDKIDDIEIGERVRSLADMGTLRDFLSPDEESHLPPPFEDESLGEKVGYGVSVKAEAILICSNALSQELGGKVLWVEEILKGSPDFGLFSPEKREEISEQSKVCQALFGKTLPALLAETFVQTTSAV